MAERGCMDIGQAVSQLGQPGSSSFIFFINTHQCTTCFAELGTFGIFNVFNHKK